MAHRAGVCIRDIEFVQFHPTALFESGSASTFLISEAVRGCGAILRNTHGERFMPDYDSRAELASRDIVSRAIRIEMKKHGSSFAWLDCRHIDKIRFMLQFPTIYDKLDSLGIDISRDMIPVLPSAHYSCGGIRTDHHSNTSLPGLYAIGESAGTGMHGANRLASNSLLEALVFAERASTDAIEKIRNQALPHFISSNLKVQASSYPLEILRQEKSKIQRLMSAVSIETSDVELTPALEKLNEIESDFVRSATPGRVSAEAVEFQNILCVAKLILCASIKRQESKGVFFKDKNVVQA